MLDHLKRLYVNIRKARNYRFRSVSDGEMRRHQMALIRLGFLEAKTVRVSKLLAAQLKSIKDAGQAVIPQERLRFTELSVPPIVSIPSAVNVVAPRQDIATWEQLIHKADEQAPPIVVMKPIGTNTRLRLRVPEDVPEIEEMIRKQDGVIRRGDARKHPK